jgi:hypothetical protein
MGNDTLFENWKVIARLSQTIAGMEEELKKVYHVAAELISDDQPVVVQIAALAAQPSPVAENTERQNDLTPTDVRIKRKMKSVKPSPAKPVAAAGKQLEPVGNAGKLLQHLKRVLTSHKFTVVNQTVIAHETGIPLGSMTAAIKKLIDSRQLVQGPTGSLKLAN